MKRQHLYLLLLAMWALGSMQESGFLSTDALAQMNERGWGFGFGMGTNILYSDLKKTGYGLSTEGYLTRRLGTHTGLTGAVGYGVLPFTIPRSPAKFATNIIRGDLRFDYEFGSAGIRPYLALGISGINYQVTSKLAGKTFKGKRVNDVGFGVGGGLRFMLGPRLALDLGGNYRYTTGDDFDAVRTNKANDAILTAMLGLTFFSGGRATDMYTDKNSTDEELSDFQQQIDQLETAPQQQPQDMQEYVRLKSRMDELNQEISQKENEISTLRTALAEKKDNVDAMQTQLANTPAVPSVSAAGFSRAYEDALSKFYAKRYSEAIAQFNGLLEQFPDHSLASNCVYWIGESYFGSGNYSEAIEAFNRVLSYPRSLKKDDALLMLGRSHLQLNHREEARQHFNRLIQEFPTSEFVAKAEEWLNRM
ncbi:MAG: tetratricopeptide repeat protein [candidate division KSB1 bacterium]|nr:tetratricopeptide repeat protein [candidate division KSB1 bacterium]MDZ7301864.1 tetratricopeptide repeat protein [candidate division KSB1 bacterium]MDZ7310247.1 tetratricopeptide repeat protein [candidate division KSB1 bacterium]